MTAKPNIHELNSDVRAYHYRQMFADGGRFHALFSADARTFPAGGHARHLRAEIIRLLKAKEMPGIPEPLETLHERIPQEWRDYSYDGGINKITFSLYETDEAFERSYLDFIKEILIPVFPFPFYFQKTLTIRTHCPKSEGSDFYPRYHTDVGYGHPPQSINIWMPLTTPVAPQQHGFRVMGMQATRRVLEEFDYDFERFNDCAVKDKMFNLSLNAFAPQVDTPFGDLLAFDARSIHTVEPLQNHTRFSIDLRILAVEDFESCQVEYQGTGRKRIRFMPGIAYYPKPSNEL